MPPLPKKKVSKARKRRRRMHLSVATPHIAPCEQCRSPKLPHHACPVCGTYRGRDVIDIGQKKPEPSTS